MIRRSVPVAAAAAAKQREDGLHAVVTVERK